VGHQDYFLAPLLRSIALFVSSLRIHIVRCNPFIMGKPRGGKVSILPSTTKRGTTLNTSIALDSPSVMSKLLTPPHADAAATSSAEFENATDNLDDASTVLNESGSLGSFLDATIARTRQLGTLLLHLLVHPSLGNALVMILMTLILSLMMILLLKLMPLVMLMPLRNF
jgi:hypothetical protein